MYYSAERVKESQKDGALCDSFEELKAVNYYREVLRLSDERVDGSVSDN